MKTKKKQPPRTAPVIEIHGGKREAVVELRAIIMDILTTDRCGDGPKEEALKTLRRMCQVGPVKIENCNFTGL